MRPYHERFPVGTAVRIAEHPDLDRFRRELHFDNKLEAEQLSCAGRTPRVRDVGFIMEVMRSIISKAFPVSATRFVFTLSNNSIRAI